MIRLIALTLAVLLSLPAAAQAAPAKADAAFGNTVLIIDPDGRSRKIWLEPGGSWSGLSRRGLALAGKWFVRGDKVCLSQSKPRLPGSLCHQFPTQPGTSLQAKDPGGKTVQLKLVQGRVRQ